MLRVEEQGIVDQIIASQHRTLHDMTHRNSPHLTHITSPHKQPDCFISPRNRPHDIKTSQIATTAHHHHGTAEGSFTAKKWFGHRAGRSPCAHSIGKFFLCYKHRRQVTSVGAKSHLPMLRLRFPKVTSGEKSPIIQHKSQWYGRFILMMWDQKNCPKERAQW